MTPADVLPLSAPDAVPQQPAAAPNLFQASALCGRMLGEILQVTTGLSTERLEEALAAQAEKGGRLGEVLVGLKAVGEEDVAKALGLQLDLPYLARIFAEEVDPE